MTTVTQTRIGRVALGISAIGVVVLGGTLAVAHWPTSTRSLGAPASGRDLVEKGRYVATAADCVACHTAPGGTPFAGGLPMETPIGVIYSTNITPDRKTGIGTYSLGDFDRAIRHGILPNGTSLFPAMPFPSYAKLTDDDVKALYAFFMQGLEPVGQENRTNAIPWPLSIRWPLALWRKAFGPGTDEPFDAGRYPDAQIARGAYLVQAAGHCGACHTPRALTLQEKALDDRDNEFLGGGQVVDGWFAVNLRGDAADGLGRWSSADIVETLRSGRNRHHAVVGSPMNDVVVHSMQHLTETDLQAIAAYLKSLGAGTKAVSTYKADDATALNLQAGHESGRGAEVYVDNCAACHRTDGKGVPGSFPAIAGNPSVLAANPVSVVRLVLAGAEMASTETAPSNLGMPGFDWRLTDREVAQLVTFLRRSWGNDASEVSEDLVAKVRTALAHEKEKRDTEVQRAATLPKGN